MSGTKKFIGLWIMISVYAVVIPWTYYLISKQFDSMIGFISIHQSGATTILAAAALLIALFWILWSYSYLHFIGRGTPVEAFGIALYPTENLVDTGPYAYTRNPMMLGLLAFLISIAFYSRSISGFILIPMVLIIEIIYIRAYEEPHLINRFGDAYKEYRRKVPMIFPKIKM